MSQQYSLKWNNHQPNFISMFTSLLNSKTLVDVTLSCDGEQLVAHKIVLSACSSYFQALFVDNPNPHPIVILKDVTYADLRTMIDFMYCGQVNVTQEQLPKVLETAKLLQIKGLTEMPLTRSQGTTSDMADSQEQSPVSPSNKRKRRRESSTCVHITEDTIRTDMNQQMEGVAMSAQPTQRRLREYNEIRTVDNSQAQEPELPLVEQPMDSTNATGNQTGGTWTMEHSYPRIHAAAATASDNIVYPPSPGSEGRHRRAKHLKRQSRVPDDGREVRKQASDPLPLPPTSAAPRPTHTLHKYESYPQFVPTKNIMSRKPRMEQEVGSLLIRAVTSGERQSSTSTTTTTTSASFESSSASDSSQTQRAKHTPAVRSGPPLSCNFCWNTVDECGRILRRKTQYHCPECRTNLCIVPCFHEYHEGPEGEANANAR